MDIEKHIRESGQAGDRTTIERSRRYRQRKATNAWFAPVDVPATALSRMIDDGIITSADSQDAAKRGKAVSHILMVYAKAKTVTP